MPNHLIKERRDPHQEGQQSEDAARRPRFQDEVVGILDLFLGGRQHQARVVFTEIAGANAQPRSFDDHPPGGRPIIQPRGGRGGRFAHAGRQQIARQNGVTQPNEQQRSRQSGDPVRTQSLPPDQNGDANRRQDEPQHGSSAVRQPQRRAAQDGEARRQDGLPVWSARSPAHHHRPNEARQPQHEITGVAVGVRVRTKDVVFQRAAAQLFERTFGRHLNAALRGGGAQFLRVFRQTPIARQLDELLIYTLCRQRHRAGQHHGEQTALLGWRYGQLAHHEEGDEQPEPFPGDEPGRELVAGGELGADKDEGHRGQKGCLHQSAIPVFRLRSVDCGLQTGRQFLVGGGRPQPEAPDRPTGGGHQPQQRQHHAPRVGQVVRQAGILAENQRPGDQQRRHQHQKGAAQQDRSGQGRGRSAFRRRGDCRRFRRWFVFARRNATPWLRIP
jgi:hypothetical protein